MQHEIMSVQVEDVFNYSKKSKINMIEKGEKDGGEARGEAAKFTKLSRLLLASLGVHLPIYC